MPRRWPLLPLFFLLGACVHPPQTQAKASRPAPPNVDGARELDREGVRAYRENRFADALAFFRESRRLGGPGNELWNIARCLEHLDDAESAALTIDEYLTTPQLSADEREEAKKELTALKTRPSSVVVTSSPTGSPVLIDGVAAPGMTTTPIAAELAPGTHAIVVHRPGYAPETRTVEAHYGRAIVVTVELVKAPTDPGKKR